VVELKEYSVLAGVARFKEYSVLARSCWVQTVLKGLAISGYVPK